MIVDDPTYEDAARILELMTVRYCKSMVMSNLEAWQRTRGTPAEVVPSYEMGLCEVIVFVGEMAGEDECWIMKPEHIERLHRGERVMFRAQGIDTRALVIMPSIDESTSAYST